MKCLKDDIARRILQDNALSLDIAAACGITQQAIIVATRRSIARKGGKVCTSIAFVEAVKTHTGLSEEQVLEEREPVQEITTHQ